MEAQPSEIAEPVAQEPIPQVAEPTVEPAVEEAAEPVVPAAAPRDPATMDKREFAIYYANLEEHPVLRAKKLASAMKTPPDCVLSHSAIKMLMDNETKPWVPEHPEQQRKKAMAFQAAMNGRAALRFH